MSLKFEIGTVRFSNPKEVEAGLSEAIRDGLAAEGITVADGQPVVLHVKHSEEPGPPYRITTGAVRAEALRDLVSGAYRYVTATMPGRTARRRSPARSQGRRSKSATGRRA